MTAVPKPQRQEKPRVYNSLQRHPKTAKQSIDYGHMAIPKPGPKLRKPSRDYGNLERSGRCAICGKWLGKGNTGWHHILYKSQGGTEAPENLIEVGFGLPWICDCHGKIHRGEISLAEVLEAKAGERLC